MSFTATASRSHSYTTADVEKAVRRFTADIIMMAQSSAAISESKARDYAHDVEVLAKKGYLDKVDLTLFSGTTEVRAAKYVVNTSAGDLTMSRPGGVLWPRVANSYFRIVLSYTAAYTPAAREVLRNQLKIGWAPTNADTSHATLRGCGGRDYASNGWGLRRTDYAA